MKTELDKIRIYEYDA